MSNSEEIEVEVVEVVDGQPTHDSTQASNRQERPNRGQARHPFGGGFGGGFRPRAIRMPAYLWPFAIILGLILFLIAIVVGLIVAIPFLIIRGIVRLLFPPSR